jgi:hypothetical protein
LKRRSILGWAAAALALGALLGWLGARPDRYRAHAGGRVRFDTETGRSEIRVQGQWVPLPEVKSGRLQARIEAAMTEQLGRQLAPLSPFAPPPLDLPAPGAGALPALPGAASAPAP